MNFPLIGGLSLIGAVVCIGVSLWLWRRSQPKGQGLPAALASGIEDKTVALSHDEIFSATTREGDTQFVDREQAFALADQAREAANPSVASEAGPGEGPTEFIPRDPLVGGEGPPRD